MAVGGTAVAVHVAVGGTAVLVGVRVAVGGSAVAVRVAVNVGTAVVVGVGLGTPPPEAGSRMKALNSGPAGSGAPMPTGVATERLSMGRLMEPPE